MYRREILIPLLTLKNNGGGLVVMEMARMLSKYQWNVVIITSKYHGIDAVKSPVNSGIRFILIPSCRIKALSILLLILCGFFYSLINKPQIIYTHSITSIIPNFSNYKALWLAQDIEYRFYKGLTRKIIKILISRLVKEANLIVTSQSLGKYFRRINSHIIFCDDIGISKMIFNNIIVKDWIVREIDILIISKFGEHKRGQESKYIANLLANIGFKVTLIDQKIFKNSYNNNLSIISSVNNYELRDLLNNTKIFINLSRSEGFGLVPLEAMYMGCKVVSTPVPSLNNIKDNRLISIRGSELIIESALDAAKFLLNQVIPDYPARNNGAMFYLEDWAESACKSIR
jgi:glycosyltransferase involved in cell wall biosynthesis